MKRKYYPTIRTSSQGFTLVELLIATSIFSTILLVVTFGIINIGKIYYRGINSTNTQSVARVIMDDIVQSIQFYGGTVTIPSPQTSPGFYCIGDKKYSFVLDKKVGSDIGNVKLALISELSAACSTSSLDGSGNVAFANYTSLIGKNMRIQKLQIESLPPNNYAVTVKVISGDDDLLEDTNGKSKTDAGYTPGQDRCKIGAGSQFCSVSELYTIVNKRI